MYRWASANHISINSQKTKIITFGDSYCLDSFDNISFPNFTLSKIDFVSCLGIIYEPSLMFERLINKVISRVGSVLKKLYSSNFALPFKIRHLLGYGLLMPHIFYSLEIYSGNL